MALRRLLGPRLLLRFEQREGVLVPQTATHWALHADVFFVAVRSGAAALTISDAHLAWEVRSRNSASVIKTLRWDRAVIEGKFRYPIQALAFEAEAVAKPLTLTFDDGLMKVPGGPPPAESFLALVLSLGDRQRPLRRDLWRVGLRSWDQARADLEWLAPRG